MRSRSAMLAQALEAPVLRSAVRRLPTWRGVLVLNYHRVGDLSGTPWDPTLLSASAAQLDEQLTVLAASVDVVAPDDLRGVAAGARGRHVLVTFDDGYRDNYEVAYPLLRAHGLPAAFFLVSGFIDEPVPGWWDELSWMFATTSRRELPAAAPVGDQAVPLAGDEQRRAAARQATERYKALPADETAAYLDRLGEALGTGRCPPELGAELWMTWSMAREMAASGMTIGGHTQTHPVLSRMTAAEQAREIDGSARRLREELDQPMRSFAYPVGARDSFTAETRDALRGAGVDVAFSFYGGLNRFSEWDALDVRRVHVDPSLPPSVFRAMIDRADVFVR